MESVKMSTIIRTVVLVLALVNNVLTVAGKSPLPIEDAQVELVLSEIFTIAAALWNWWKNNSFTQAALKADRYMAELKAGEQGGPEL